MAHTLALGDGGGTVQLWDVAHPAHPDLLSQPFANVGVAIYSVALSPDGAHAGQRRQLRHGSLWDVADPARPRPLSQPHDTGGFSEVQRLRSAPTGSTLACGDADGTIRLWDVADPAHPRPFGPIPDRRHRDRRRRWHSAPTGTSWPAVTPAARSGCGTSPTPHVPSPLGQPLTSARRRRRCRWRSALMGTRWLAAAVTAPSSYGAFPTTVLTGSTSVVDSVSFGPDRHVLADGDTDGAVRLWDVTDPAHPRLLGRTLTSSSTAPVAPAAFSPDWHTLASGGADSVVRLWMSPTQYTPAARPNPVDPPSRPDSIELHRSHRFGGVQPRRAHAGQRRHRRRSPVVGCRRPRASPPARPAT